MSLRRSAALFRQNLLLLLSDPGPIVVTTLMPLVLMAFLQGMGRTVLRAEGFATASGAEQVVPGMAVLFSFFGVGYLGMAFFQEHGWGTWQRLRASAAHPGEILIGKMLPAALVILAQLVVLFGAGILLFGLEVRGSIAGLLVMMAASTVFLVGLAMLCVAVFRTINQLMATVNVGAMAVAGLGGALAPLSVLPGWAGAVAPASPAYWALDGFRAVVLEGAGLSATLAPAGVLLAFAAVCAAGAAARFRFADEKVWSM